MHVLLIDRSSHNISCHCYYRNRNCPSGADLDVDNQQGGDRGAETITLTNQVDQIYAIFVYDSRPDINNPLIHSSANIDIYGLQEGFKQFRQGLLSD